MKKILLSILFLMTYIVAFAQKSYINMLVYADYYYQQTDVVSIKLSGDVPPTFVNYYDKNSKKTIGGILNDLSNYGYNVEYMGGPELRSDGGNYCIIVYLLSKESSNQSNAIEKMVSEEDADVHEVARYNLQGLPIHKNEKGVQIIVYSNYTTKTIIVE